MHIGGIGIDVVDIKRVSALLKKQGERFQKRVFAKEEIRYCTTRKNSAAHFAARWAAKEAFLKALGNFAEGVRLADIEVVRKADAPPFLLLKNTAREAADKKGAGQTFLSISHSAESAVAVVMFVGKTDHSLVE